MNCQETKELFSEYLDRRLNPAEASSVEEHFQACSDCRLEFAALEKTVSLVGSLDEIEPSPGFLSQVEKRINRGATVRRIWAWMFEPVKFKVSLEVTALIILIIIAFQVNRKPEFLPERQGGPARSEELETSPAGPPAVPPKSENTIQESRRAEPKAALEPKGDIPGPRPAESVGEPASEIRIDSLESRIEEITAEDVTHYAAMVKALLEKMGGKLLREDDLTDSGLLLTVALPQSRRNEFLSRIREEAGRKTRRQLGKEGAASLAERDKKKVEQALKSALPKDEPAVTLRLRILPIQ